MNKTTLLLGSVCCFALVGAASAETLAGAPQTLSYQSFLSSMGTAGGDSTVAWEVAPSYSELFGLGVRAAVGTRVSDGFALGAIIDIAKHREEYLANAGVQLNDSMRIVATAGLLKEREEFVLGDGREDVQQLQYGLSLKGNYDAGLFRGYEINAYHTNGSSDTDAVETGDLTGLQIVTALKPSDTADIRIGAGYERAEWDGGDVDEGYTLQALGSLKVSDTLSLNYAAKSAETENSYGLGLTFDMSTPDVMHSSLSVSFNEIQGKQGISDDTRVAINWTVGLGGAAGAGSDTTVSSMGSVTRADLLADVMTRPAFLPDRVMARAGEIILVCNYKAYRMADTTENNEISFLSLALEDAETFRDIFGQQGSDIVDAIVSFKVSVDGGVFRTYSNTPNSINYVNPRMEVVLDPTIPVTSNTSVVEIIFSTSLGENICFKGSGFSSN